MHFRDSIYIVANTFLTFQKLQFSCFNFPDEFFCSFASFLQLHQTIHSIFTILGLSMILGSFETPKLYQDKYYNENVRITEYYHQNLHSSFHKQTIIQYFFNFSLQTKYKANINKY